MADRKPPASEPHPSQGGHGEPHAAPGPAAHPGTHPAHPPVHRMGVATGDLLYLSAMLLSSLWAAVLLFVVYPESPVDAGFAPDDVPVMSLQGNVVTVKRAQLEEALAAGRYLPASREQVDCFEAQRRATLVAVKRDKLVGFAAAAAFPGVALLLFRVWWRARQR